MQYLLAQILTSFIQVMQLGKVLITDGVHPILPEKLRRLGYEIVYKPKSTLEEVKKEVEFYEGLIINSKIIVDKEFLDLAKKLKWIGRLGSGLEIIDLAYAAKRGVRVISSPEGNRNAVAEHMIGMLLALANNLVRIDAEVRDKFWDREAARGFEISGKVIGLIGFGNTGQAMARKLAGFGVDILAYDKYKSIYSDEFPTVKSVEIQTLLQTSDIISLHLPLTKETTYLANDEFFNSCKNGFVFLNGSRGKCVELQSLLKALENGKCRGACLDVFENEKPTSYSESESLLYQRLFDLPNTILSPHVAGWTNESKEKLANIIFEKLIAPNTV